MKSLMCALFALTLLALAPQRAEASTSFLGGARLVDDLGFQAPTGTLVEKLRLDTPRMAGGVLPCALSFLIPGLGQLLNGQLMKALIVFGSFTAAATLAAVFQGVPLVAGVFGLVGLAIWVAGWVDAYNGGTIIPYGSAGDAADEPRPVIRPIEAPKSDLVASTAFTFSF